MAGGGDDGEMNPYISYVDLFSSVILVLLLFVLIMFVNVGYYMQFTSKDARQMAPESAAAKKVETVTPEQNHSPVQGNTLSKNTEKEALVEFKESDLMFIFKNNEYFLSKEMISQMTKVMDKILKTRPNASFVISVGDSKKLISSTQTKQVSLGRVLSFKNNLEGIQNFKNKIKINYKSPELDGFEFGYLKIDVK